RLREVVAAFGPRALPQRVRRVLNETGHDVFSRRRQGRVHGGRHAHVDERTVGEVAVLRVVIRLLDVVDGRSDRDGALELRPVPREGGEAGGLLQDRKSTRLNSSHVSISYAVFCLKKKNKR